ncbi:hypothetical protein EGI22_06620 [Lacihabitans sp. LS3-19]|uniref:hypothetical protein n=1 Tax=Lacihabitans sp. LS3-19 TaxID=2487335 RepID=UPI0020CE7038|nr:hypothetical protein [Lacihabitans sp. LS3-19]MCP9767579.1 hypothetical protein [Lacihabitans sp. LS3-19]
MKSKLLTTILLALIPFIGFPQNVTILPDGITPAPSGQIPRLEYDAIMNLGSPQKGDLAYDLTYDVMRCFNGSKWIYFLSSDENPQPLFTAWKAGGSTSSASPSSNLSQILSISVDATGNIYATGQFLGNAYFGNANMSTTGSSDYDIFIAKFSSSGTLTWAKRAGGTGFDYGNSIKVGGDGNIYVTGGFSNTANFNTPSSSGTNEIISDGNLDIFIAKYDNNGNLLRINRAGGSGLDFGQFIDANLAGEVFLSGIFSNTANFNTPSSNIENTLVTNGASSDIFLAKFNSQGLPKALNRIGGSLQEYLGKMVLSSAGNIFLCGSFYNTINFNTPSASGSNELTSAQGEDIFVAKFNYGTEQWDFLNRIGGTGDENSPEIAVNNNEDLFVTAKFSNNIYFGNPISPSNFPLNVDPSKSNIFLAKILNGSTTFSSIFSIIKCSNGNGVSNLSMEISQDNSIFLSFTSNAKCSYYNPAGVEIASTYSPESNISFTVAKYNSTLDFLWAKKSNNLIGPNGISDIYHPILTSMSLKNNNEIYFSGGYGANLMIGNTNLQYGVSPADYSAFHVSKLMVP